MAEPSPSRAERAGPRLVLVATPLGNLEDITLRSLRALREAQVVFAEDTRRARALYSALELAPVPPLERFDEHTEHARADAVAERIAREGLCAVLVTDAGSPAVSDPGALLVRAAVARGVPVEALPGPCAAVLAVQLAAVPCAQGFRFVGFLPREGLERRAALLRVATDELPTVLYEAPGRVRATLRDLAAVCGDARLGAVARELTKRFEEVRRGALGELVAGTPDEVLGEVAIVVAGAAPHVEAPSRAENPSADEPSSGASAEQAAAQALDRALDAALHAGMKPSDAAREVARALGLRRADVYQRALARGSSKPR